MPMKPWPNIPKKLPSRTLREFKGSNKLDPYSIGDGYSPNSKNISSSKTPSMTTRPGFSLLGTPFGSKVLGLSAWKNSELHAVFGDGVWRKWNGSSWVTVKSGLNTTADWSFCNFKANLGAVNLIGANGIDPVQRYDGTNALALTNAPTGLKYIDQHDNRLYGATTNNVHFSGLSLADSWTLVSNPNDSSPGQIVRETNDGEDIVGLLSGAGHVTVFFPSSSHELYGTSPSDFEFQIVAADIGGINDQCIVNLGGLLYFLDETGIYMYAGGTRPRKEFSKVVQWHVDNMNKSAKKYCCVGADGRYLYVGLPMTSSTSADTILVYDTIEKTWDVWEDLKPTHMLKMGDYLYMADSLGRVMQIGGTSDNGVPINWKWESKILTGQSMSQNMRLIKMFVTMNKPAGSTAKIYFTNQPETDSGWVEIGTISEVGIQDRSVPVLPTATVWGKYLRLKIEGSGPCTIREISWDEVQSAVR